MSIKQFDIWIADLSPQIGTESGKKRPVVVIQTDLLNEISHPSTIVCPVTTRVKKESEVLRVHLKKGMAQLTRDSDIMIDQIWAVDNRRLVKKLGSLPQNVKTRLKENISIVLDLE
ncbi:MAG: type II toxin-antitoxin system PemK/MazF family toxin [Bacteroidales bacterium]